MSETTTTQPESTAKFTQSQVDVLIAAAKAEAITGEVNRRRAISALAQPGYELELQAALDGTQGPEAFAMACMLAAKERDNRSHTTH